MIRTSNPAFRGDRFGGFVGASAAERERPAAMTIAGAVNKTALLLVILVAAASFTWMRFFRSGAPEAGLVAIAPFLVGGFIGSLVFSLATIFKPTWSPVTAPLYAAAEGLALGAVSALFQQRYPGIVLQAVMLTMGTLAVLLAAYKSGVIKATENFKLGVVAATGAIALLYLVSFVLGFFGIHIGFIHSSGTFGILFSLFVVVVAALNLVLDFDFIERGAERGAPKHMEWYAGFALLLTLVWLYLEILRLLAKLNDRKR